MASSKIVAVVLATVLCVAGCADPALTGIPSITTMPDPSMPRPTIPPGAFVMEVTSEAEAVDSIAWGGAAQGMQQMQDVALPWSTYLQPGNIRGVSLTLQVDLAPSDTAAVTCTISQDGRVLATDTNAGGALCTTMVITQ